MRGKRWSKLASLSAGLLLISFGYLDRVRSQAQSAEQQTAQKAVAILQARCVQCHGADKSGGLDLRTRDGLLKGGARGSALKPGASDASLLYRVISGQEKPRMPLGGELAAEEITALKTWIEQGAVWPENEQAVTALAASYAGGKPITDEQRNYWAFRKPVRSALPEVKNKAWVRTPVDAFVLAKLEARGLTPSPRADKRTLLRRVTFDLTGLPPTAAELSAFLADQSPDAYEKVVQRLLASPRYGERWAQHWLDVVRFGETNGFELDQDREQAWRYRDYVVQSLNQDKPYDRFLLEQIAGDELAPDDFEMRVATGFLRAGPQHVVAGNQDEALNRQEWLTEVMFGVGNGVLGLTVGCARCHDHKFDPIPQADYYRLQSFFAAADNYDFKPPNKDAQAAYDEAVKAHKAKLKPVLDQIEIIEKPYKERLKAEKRAKLEPVFAQALAKPEKERTEDEKRVAKDAQRMLNVSWDELLAALNPADKEKRAALRQQMHKLDLYAPEPPPKALAVADVISPVPAMHVLKGGDVHRQGAVVTPRFLSVLSPKDASSVMWIKPVQQGEFKSSGRRLALARWLTETDHPLTTRVMANRLWHYHFGRGIVGTPNDFGRNGEQPTHPELLDWLATEFTQPTWNAGQNSSSQAWRLKRMHALLVLSNTYQQDSLVTDAKAKLDPDNKLLWRMNRQRLDAETLRDAILAVAGNLTEQAGGPPVRVPLEPEVYDTIFTEQEPDNLWPVHPDPRQHTRRTLYLVRKRNVRLPLLVAFDAPDLMSSCGARSVSVHALQALTLMNSDFMLQQSKTFAARLWREGNGQQRAMITRLYELALGRAPRVAEVQLTQQFLRSQTALLAERQARGETIARVPELPPMADAATVAAWVDLCLATLNLNEFLFLR